MQSGRRWLLLGMIALPTACMTVYLLWIWPRPAGTSFLAQTGPYLLCLSIGAPFAWLLSRSGRRLLTLFVYLIVGFFLMWIYALAVLCGFRGACL
jgi:hypothetical protein